MLSLLCSFTATDQRTAITILHENCCFVNITDRLGAYSTIAIISMEPELLIINS